jgi:hypothetical protein
MLIYMLVFVDWIVSPIVKYSPEAAGPRATMDAKWLGQHQRLPHQGLFAVENALFCGYACK